MFTSQYSIVLLFVEHGSFVRWALFYCSLVIVLLFIILLFIILLFYSSVLNVLLDLSMAAKAGPHLHSFIFIKEGIYMINIIILALTQLDVKPLGHLRKPPKQSIVPVLNSSVPVNYTNPPFCHHLPLQARRSTVKQHLSNRERVQTSLPPSKGVVKIQWSFIC